MEWFHKKWIIDEEEGEQEFLSTLFGTSDIVCANEDVSTFHLIHVAGNMYVIIIFFLLGTSHGAAV